ncbi:MAG: hypothetical protein HN833_02475 [Elusimicrobiaceae bacterium]|nr:hypothetical protein [Elusimicrobiaceae bacterium]MBT4008411.1 hypothetical protein [Elusimicrobiaceae bacterium]MBT4439875.1 hypothetical protein [Elusimicrobiaceae bacterium]MBT5987339.1 hypothetical protein [Elusimicrobiaceae bacterium]MBT6715182.1 hypothetical protein [Elusimicrobiaceae bacterium]
MLDNIEIFLGKYKVLSGLFLVPFVGWISYKVIMYLYDRFFLKIHINPTSTRDIFNPGGCISKLVITNNKKKDLNVERIDLVVCNDKTNYILTLNLNTDIVHLKSGKARTLNIPPTSAYLVDGKSVDIAYLMMIKKTFYFILHTNKNKFIVDKKFTIKKRTKKIIQTFTTSFKDIVHSMYFKYAFTCEHPSNHQFIGFIDDNNFYLNQMEHKIPKNKDPITHLKEVLASNGFKNIQITDLLNPLPTPPKKEQYTMLGDTNKKKISPKKEGTITFNIKDIQVEKIVD